MASILITLPKTVDWNDYLDELKVVEDGTSVLNFKVPSLPKNCSTGDKCYVCYRGNIIGYMEIVGFASNSFNCTTTNKEWKGLFIQRSGKFTFIEPFPYKGFQGYRYITPEIEKYLRIL